MPQLCNQPLLSPDVETGSTESLLVSPKATVQRLIAFIDNGTSAELHALLAATKPLADSFAAQFRASPAFVPDAELSARLNRWFDCQVGRETSAALMNAAIEMVESCKCQGHPGHDRRHVLYMDPLSALRHCVEDNISDYRSLFLIGALLHDAGRLPEPRLYGAPASGVNGTDHQYISYYVVQELLKAFPALPVEIRDSIAFSVLVHQNGKDGDNFAAQFVQRADREQLVGPEFLLRAIGCNVGYGRVGLKIPTSETRSHSLVLPGKPEETDIASHIEFYMRNLYPNIGSQGEKHAENLKVISGVFLALAHGEELFNQLFAPELARDRGEEPPAGKFKTILKTETWEKILNVLRGDELEEARGMVYNNRGRDADLIHEFVTPSGTPELTEARVNELDPNSASMMSMLMNAWNELSENEKECYRLAFAYGLLARWDNEETLKLAVQFSAKDSCSNAVTSILQRFVRGFD